MQKWTGKCTLAARWALIKDADADLNEFPFLKGRSRNFPLVLLFTAEAYTFLLAKLPEQLKIRAASRARNMLKFFFYRG